jgi:ribosome-binding factor A
MTDRLDRVNEVIKEEVSQALLRELDLEEGILVTVTRVDTTRTLEHSKVWLSIYPEDKAEEVLEQIDRQIYDIQQIVNKRLHMKPTPKIIFKIDKGGQAVGEVEEIVKKLYNK